MKSSKNYIKDSVYNVNLKYVKMQNATKELFFKYLDEGRDVEDFEKKLKTIWGNLDHSFLDDEIEEYENIIHKENMKDLDIEEPKEKSKVMQVLPLVPVAVALKQEKKFQNVKTKEYKISLNSPAYKLDKDSYLKMKIQRYSNQVVPYYSKSGKKLYDVQLSTYEAMIHNTNLTRSGWNTTLQDASDVGEQEFYIAPHNFSCPDCADLQGRPLSLDEVMDLVGSAEEGEEEILHPNCKCVLTIYNKNSKLSRPKYSSKEIEQQYEIRQKVNSLTLKKEEIISNMKIAKENGYGDLYDKYNEQRNKINSSIRDLKEEIPTAELQKQVVAINR